MTKEELVVLVAKITEAADTEQELDEMLEVFLKNVPDPNASDYLFYNELSPEEVVDRALAYKPIQL